MLWEVIWKRIVLVFVVNLGSDQLEIAVLNIILLQMCQFFVRRHSVDIVS
jgi:hypothetical protein